MPTNPSRSWVARRLAHLMAGSSLVALALVATHGSAQAQFVCSGTYSEPSITIDGPPLLALQANAAPSIGANALATTQRSGDGGAVAFDFGSMACGLRAQGTGPNGTTVGNFSSTGGGSNNTAVGSSAVAGAFSYGDIGNDLSIGNATAVGGNAYAGLHATAIGAGATAYLDAAGLGSSSYASEKSTAIGSQATAYGKSSVVVGYNANDGTLDRQVVLGAGAGVNPLLPDNATAVTGSNVALGADSVVARGAQTAYTAYGLGQPVTSIGEVSVGTQAGNRQITGVAAGSQGNDAVNLDQLRGAIDGAGVSAPIVGANVDRLAFPTATGANATAAGFGASATGRNSVALGSGSVADRDGTVSFGSVGAERVLANVGPGTAGTDAANVNQLNAVGVQMSSISGQVNGLGGRITTLEQGTGGTVVGPTYPVSANNLAGAGAPTSAGANALALGYGAQAQADNSVAVGTGSVADQANTVSFGSVGNARRLTNIAAGIDDGDAVNVGQMRQAIAAIPEAAYVPVATSNASGLPRPVASGTDALALGYGAQASGQAAVAIGRSTASGARSASLGDGAAAAGDGSLALGNASSASGTSATAVGDGSVASGNRSTAVGTGATATAANATAIGAGARATRANQVAIGTSGSTYTMGGVASAASRAQQTGPAYFATTDAQGNLAATTFDTGRIDTMDNHLSSVDARVGGVENRMGNVEARVAGTERNIGILRNDIRRTGEGVSIAMAMAGVQLPSEKTYALSANWGYFDGENGLAATGAARINESVIVHAGVGVGANRGTVGARAGITYGW